MDHGLAGFGQFFIVFAETAIPSQPTEGPLHHPAVGEYGETGDVVASFDDFQHPTPKLKRPVNQLPRITAVSSDQLETTELTFEFGQHHLGPISILHVGAVNHHGQDQPQRVYDNMPLATLDLLAGIIAANPFFSVVFTL